MEVMKFAEPNRFSCRIRRNGLPNSYPVKEQGEGCEMDINWVGAGVAVVVPIALLGIAYFVVKGAREFFRYIFGMEADAIQGQDEGDGT